jgi:hypothetical protein
MSYRGKTIDLSKYEQYGKEKEAVELAKMEVELSLIDDVKELIEAGNKNYDSGLSEVRDGAQRLKNAVKFYSDCEKKGQEAIKKANDLGIKITEVENITKTASKNLSLSQDALKKVSSI